ncbi:non-homologous end-joining DNA ligase [Flexivirga meconopsidis]|uniref:non-homologous end-joining DNA ligase n=1 Tax=Flexivirga meconopsidis TaxID=2977121 RepID=UPI002240B3BF|nr:non-homologous end-joining DNA ligase [Flexivirga meconopsidis]
MLATAADAVPAGDAWIHEVKWDGMRLLVQVRGDVLRLFSRTEREVTVAFPELARPAAGLTGYDDLLLDAEVVVLRDGRPSFAALAERFNVADAATAARLAGQSPVTLMMFDVLQAMNTPTIGLPLRQRRQLLEGLDLNSRYVQTPPVFEDGTQLLAATADQGIEGVVSKRLASPYQPGRRSLDWRKTVHRKADSFVIAGWLPERENDRRLGAVLLATPTPDGPLLYRGRVGSGLAGTTGESLRASLEALAVANSPFAEGLPPDVPGGVQWVRPELVTDVEFLGVTEGGQLRQPTWRGIRHDLTVADLVRTEVTDG